MHSLAVVHSNAAKVKKAIARQKKSRTNSWHPLNSSRKHQLDAIAFSEIECELKQKHTPSVAKQNTQSERMGEKIKQTNKTFKTYGL